MPFKMSQIDAFCHPDKTHQTYSGNPAAVCLLDAPQSKEWMQDVAAEMNLSETAFLQREKEGYALRWFTPVSEVDLCGHATLASAHFLWECGEAPNNAPLSFSTLSGPLVAKKSGDLIEIDLPSDPERTIEVPNHLAEILGIRPVYAGIAKFDLLIELENEALLRGLEPNFSALSKIDTRGFILTARASDQGIDFVSRFFAPRVGIDEDPVTGSAHCCLGPYWQKKLGKDKLLAHQLSKRGGVIHVAPQGERVVLGGHSNTVMQGTLL